MPTHRHAIHYYTSGGAVADGSNYKGDRAVPLDHAVTSREIYWQQMFQAEMGGNQPHNNMPPYVVAYCWQRIA